MMSVFLKDVVRVWHVIIVNGGESNINLKTKATSLIKY